jgi:hypothetical protein
MSENKENIYTTFGQVHDQKNIFIQPEKTYKPLKKLRKHSSVVQIDLSKFVIGHTRKNSSR